MAENAIGLYKTECVRHEGPWRGVDDLELATLSWIHWFNETQLHGSIGHVPPTEFETQYYGQNWPSTKPGALQCVGQWAVRACWVASRALAVPFRFGT
jgi:hypothetical protein